VDRRGSELAIGMRAGYSYGSASIKLIFAARRASAIAAAAAAKAARTSTIN